MANLVYNRGKFLLASGVNMGTADLRMLLVNASYAANADHNSVADVVGNEISVSGYSRQQVANKTITEDDTNDVVFLDADDVTFNSLVTGQTVGGAVLYRHNASDSAAEVICFYDLTDTPTNGGDIQVQFAAAPNGVLKLA